MVSVYIFCDTVIRLKIIASGISFWNGSRFAIKFIVGHYEFIKIQHGY
jgi:hypothetical protein